MRKSEPPIVVQQSFNVSAEVLWKAITELPQMHQWFFDNIPDFQPTIGFTTNFPVYNEDRVFTHLWTITAVIPNQLITYNWKYEEYPGDSSVTFEILEKENESILKLSTKIIEDFPQDIPEFKRESAVGGWNYFIGESLKKYIDNLV